MDVGEGRVSGQLWRAKENGNKKSTCLQYLFYFVMSKGDIYKQTCKSLFRHVFGPFLEGFNSCAVEGISLKVKLRHWESEAFSDVSGFHSLNLDGNWSKRKFSKKRKKMCRDLYKLPPTTPWKMDGPLGPLQDELSFQSGAIFHFHQFLGDRASPTSLWKVQCESLCVAWKFYDLS